MTARRRWTTSACIVAVLGLTACATTTEPDAIDSEDSPDPAAPIESIAAPSAGCSTQFPGGTYDLTIRSGGRGRAYRAVVPSTYRPGAPSALVLSLHGRGGDINAQVGSGLNQEGEANNYVIVYPQGVPDERDPAHPTAWNAGSCCGTADDVQFLRDVVNHAEANLCIDKKRVYAAGFSMGAFMVQTLACKASDVFAAVISNSGTLMVRSEDCHPTQPVSVLEIHGANDWGVCMGGNAVCNDPNYYASVSEDLRLWRTLNKITSRTRVSYRNGNAVCWSWENPTAAVQHCRVEGMEHCWAGLGGCAWDPAHNSYFLSTNREISKFIAAHRKP